MIMPKGGARTRSGPPPDPNALSRDASDWIVLPATGRQGNVPGWPLPEPSDRETHLWAKVWALPQAIVWEHQSQHLEVALYVRRLSQAEQHESSTQLGTLVRQMSDSLGITTPGMRANRWRIEKLEQPVPAVAESRAKRTSARDRFRVVDGDGA
jgi:hypothetical protein